MALSCKKAQDQVQLSLAKNNLSGIEIDVEFIGDVSGSMHGMYGVGKPMEDVLQKAIAVASIIDPNKELTVTAFSDISIPLGTFSTDEYDSIADAFDGSRSQGFWSGTNYASPIGELVDTHKNFGKEEFEYVDEVKTTKTEPSFFSRLFGAKAHEITEVTQRKVKKPSLITEEPKPKLVLFFTDGEDYGNQNLLYKQLKYLVEKTNIFVMFIGIGTAKSTLQKLDEDFDGIGAVCFNNTKELTDEDFADLLITREFSEWYNRKVLKSTQN